MANGKPRTKYIQIPLTEEEYAEVRRKFGKGAAAIARDNWLGFEMKAATSPEADSILPMARALYACLTNIQQLEIENSKKKQPERIVKELQLLSINFNHLITVWSSISSSKTQ